MTFCFTLLHLSCNLILPANGCFYGNL
uniref:Uncharacterized protein n=1 Tax=Anguilla anguilla TaxID=7936 RepID=A0A0E9VP12_ANGAN